MEVSSSNIKKILIFSQKKTFLMFSQKKAFLIFPKTERCTFQSKLEKEKIIHPEKNSYISENRNPAKTSYIFLKRRLFLCFRKSEPRKNSLYFRKENFPSSKNEKTYF